jgi:hypothetical protein
MIGPGGVFGCGVGFTGRLGAGTGVSGGPPGACSGGGAGGGASGGEAGGIGMRVSRSMEDNAQFPNRMHAGTR